MKKVGILALQGDFSAHAEAILKAGGHPILVTQQKQFEGIDGLIIPGGESTTLLKLIEYENLQATLSRFGKKKPIFGTCAGAILMATEVCNPKQFSFGWVNIKIERNAYGRQIDSRIVSLQAEVQFGEYLGASAPFEAVFIRAPRIIEAGPEVSILVRYQDSPVLVEQGLHLVATFHPELSQNLNIHQFFLQKLQSIDHLEPA